LLVLNLPFITQMASLMKAKTTTTTILKETIMMKILLKTKEEEREESVAARRKSVVVALLELEETDLPLVVDGESLLSNSARTAMCQRHRGMALSSLGLWDLEMREATLHVTGVDTLEIWSGYVAPCAALSSSVLAAMELGIVPIQNAKSNLGKLSIRKRPGSALRAEVHAIALAKEARHICTSSLATFRLAPWQA
jgi:hypothetical protein